MDQLHGSAGRISWTDQMDRPAGWTSCTDQLDRPAGRTSSLCLKPWPIRIFEDWPFSLYIVAASESNEGLFFKWSYPFADWNILFSIKKIPNTDKWSFLENTFLPIDMDNWKHLVKQWEILLGIGIRDWGEEQTHLHNIELLLGLNSWMSLPHHS